MRARLPKGATLRPLLVLLALVAACLAGAHPANVAASLAKVKPDGTYSVRIRFDLLALATGATPSDADDEAMNALLDGPDANLKSALADAESRFRSGFAILGAGTPSAPDAIPFPTVDEIRRYLKDDPRPRLPYMASVNVTGKLPKGTRSLSLRYPALLGSVIQTVEFPYQEPISEPVEPNTTSSRLTIPTEVEVAKLAAEMNRPREAPPEPAKAPVVHPPVATPEKKPETKPQAAEKEPSPPVEANKPVLKPPVTEAGPKPLNPAPPALEPAPSEPISQEPVVEEPAPVRRTGPSGLVYLKMGFTHIVPEGLDHILFVLGLFLLGNKTKSLISQITAFTVAHSITLALTTLGIIRLPASVIEPVIAISIAFVAIENLFMKEAKPWRLGVIFLFGLVHGMGFAEVFADAGLRGAGLLTALLSFNVGVELGQLTVVAAAMGVVGWFRSDPRYRKVVVIPSSAAIAALALFWSAQRIFGG